MNVFNLCSKKTIWRQIKAVVTVTCIASTVSLTVLAVGGCSHPNSGNNSTVAGVTIFENEVIVDKSFVYSTTPERYQPSFNLRGTLAPIEQVDIASPYNGYDLDIEVLESDWVENRQILAHLQTELDSDVALSAKYDDIDVLTDKRAALSEETVSDTIEETLEEAIPDGLERYESDDEDTTYSESNTGSKDSLAKRNENNMVDSHIVESNITAPRMTVKQSKNSDNKSDSKNEGNLENKVIVSSKTTAHDGEKSSNKGAVNNQKTSSTQANTDDGVVAKLDSSSEKRPKSNNKEAQETIANKESSNQQKAKADELKMFDIEDSRSKVQSTQKLKASLTFRSPIEGEVIHIDNNIAKSKTLVKHTPFMTIADTRQLQLIGSLPLVTGSQSTESQLSVGQSVNFKVYDTHTEFTGQISHVIPEPSKGYLVVRAPVIPSADNKAVLEYGMQALMTIEYGQIELGVRVPREAINEANLDSLNKKYPRPVSPISGYVWVIGQDEHLVYTPIEVVRYFPDTDKFLVHGISNDSLICTASLPKSADGKRLSID